MKERVLLRIMAEAEGGNPLYRKWIKMLTSQRAAPERLVDRAESKVDTSAWTEKRVKWPLTSLQFP